MWAAVPAAWVLIWTSKSVSSSPGCASISNRGGGGEGGRDGGGGESGSGDGGGGDGAGNTLVTTVGRDIPVMLSPMADAAAAGPPAARLCAACTAASCSSSEFNVTIAVMPDPSKVSEMRVTSTSRIRPSTSLYAVATKDSGRDAKPTVIIKRFSSTEPGCRGKNGEGGSGGKSGGGDVTGGHLGGDFGGSVGGTGGRGGAEGGSGGSGYTEKFVLIGNNAPSEYVQLACCAIHARN
jgi:hypothetical protein|eukprot:6645280-Prymnesium_polylepis.2